MGRFPDPYRLIWDLRKRFEEGLWDLPACGFRIHLVGQFHASLSVCDSIFPAGMLRALHCESEGSQSVKILFIASVAYR